MKNRKLTSIEHLIFPGISILYLTSHAAEGRLAESLEPSADVFEIYHCREGRMECSIGADYCYIAPGDLLVAKKDMVSSAYSFPLRHYHGIIIRIDTKTAPKCLSCFLRDVNVQPQNICDKFCAEKGYFVARSNPSFEHIFSELYHVPAEIRQGYSKIKLLELMLFLSAYDMAEPSKAPMLPPSQVKLAKEVAQYLAEHMEERLTLEQASHLFHASVTNIKSSFKAVYGVSFYAYLKARKMESAAYMLEYTDKTILEIAGEHGYDNAGKFASAFRSVKGMAPGEYRSQNQVK